jgi:putative ABC transport system permease protein
MDQARVGREDVGSRAGGAGGAGGVRHRLGRAARRDPGFALAVLLALALGVGLGGPAAALVHGGLQRPAAYTDPLLREDGSAAEWLPGWSGAERSLLDLQDDGFGVLLRILLLLGGLLLAIAIANLVVLLLARAAERRAEVATRVALGARPGRLAAQLLGEWGALALAGGGLGLLLGVAVDRLLRGAWPHEESPWEAAGTGAVAAVVAGLLLTALLAWLAPLGLAVRRDLRRFLAGGGRATPGPGEVLVRNGLVVVQIAAALLLLISAGLLVRAFAGPPERAGEPGFEARGLLTVQLRAPSESSASERAVLYESVLRRVRAIPGVVDTSLATTGTWVGLGTEDQVHALTGNPLAPGWVRPARYGAVGPDHFRTLGVPVRGGREFTAGDRAGSEKVVIVNQTFVNRFRLAGDPVGKRLQLHGMSLDGAWYTVVGVVADLPTRGLGARAEPAPAVYLAALQHPPAEAGLAVRVEGDPHRLAPAVAAAVRAAGPGITLSAPLEMPEYLDRLRAPLRWFGGVLALLAAGALVLAGTGLYGVMSYNVARRTREIGVRMALGASPRGVLRLVLRQSLRLVALGSLLGLIAAGGVARLLQLLVRGVEPLDPLPYVVITLALAALALLAGYRPARRAAAVDPQISLRAE